MREKIKFKTRNHQTGKTVWKSLTILRPAINSSKLSNFKFSASWRCREAQMPEICDEKSWENLWWFTITFRLPLISFMGSRKCFSQLQTLPPTTRKMNFADTLEHSATIIYGRSIPYRCKGRQLNRTTSFPRHQIPISMQEIMERREKFRTF